MAFFFFKSYAINITTFQSPYLPARFSLSYLCCRVRSKCVGAGHDHNAREAIVKRNEKQGRELFSRQCFSVSRTSPQAMFSGHICPWLTWEMTQIWSAWFVSGTRPPPYSACSQWRLCANSDVINPLDTLTLQPSPKSFTLWQYIHVSIGGVWRRVRIWVLFSLPVSSSPPPVFRGSGRSDLSLGKTTTRWS